MESPSSQAPLLVTLAVIAIAGTLTWFLLNPNPGSPPPSVTPTPTSKPASPESAETPTPTPTSLPTSPPQPSPGSIRPAAQPTRKPINVSQMIRLPDGAYIPTINGVENPKPLPWPPGRPWSPIIGTQRGTDGLDWFIHADGVRSQVRMLYRSDLNREDPTWLTAEPMEARPPAPGEGEQPVPKEPKKQQ